MGRPRLLLAEDHAAVAVRLRAVLESDFDVLVTVADGYAMLGAVRSLHPDAIVSDVSMPLLDGIAAATEILRTDPAARIIFVSVHGEPAVVQQAMDIGAAGFVSKLTAGEDLVPAVQAALRGESYVSACLARVS